MPPLLCPQAQATKSRWLPGDAPGKAGGPRPAGPGSLEGRLREPVRDFAGLGSDSEFCPAAGASRPVPLFRRVASGRMSVPCPCPQLQLSPVELSELHADLKIQERDEFAWKKLKAEGLDEDGEKEAQLIRNLNGTFPPAPSRGTVCRPGWASGCGPSVRVARFLALQGSVPRGEVGSGPRARSEGSVGMSACGPAQVGACRGASCSSGRGLGGRLTPGKPPRSPGSAGTHTRRGSLSALRRSGLAVCARRCSEVPAPKLQTVGGGASLRGSSCPAEALVCGACAPGPPAGPVVCSGGLPTGWGAAGRNGASF